MFGPQKLEMPTKLQIRNLTVLDMQLTRYVIKDKLSLFMMEKIEKSMYNCF